MTRPRCKASAIGWRPADFLACLDRGWTTCRCRSRPRIAGPARATAVDLATGAQSDPGVRAPISGREFFEQVIRGQLDLGRPDRIQLLFNRKYHQDDSWSIPDAGDHPWRPPQPARRVPALLGQAVLQGRARPAHRDHHQRHHRLRDRQTADQSARAAGDRLLRQPAPAARPINQPRPDHRHFCPARHHRTHHHRDRRPYPRPAPGRAAQPRPARRPAAVPTAAQRLRQQRPARVDRRTARSRHCQLEVVWTFC